VGREEKAGRLVKLVFDAWESSLCYCSVLLPLSGRGRRVEGTAAGISERWESVFWRWKGEQAR
jgi:hypothetical protein